MFKSKATDILSYLSKTEMKELKAFVNSPFFNKNKKIVKLFDTLKLYYPDFKNPKCTRELIYIKVYGIENYNDKLMRNLLSEFYKLLELYLFYKESRSSSLFEIFTLNGMERMETLFSKKLNEVEIFYNSEKISNDTYWLKSLILHSKINYYLSINKQNKIAKDVLHAGEYRIFDLIFSLPITISDMLANKASFSTDYGHNSFDVFLKHFDFTGFIKDLDEKDPHYGLLRLQYNISMMLNEKNPESSAHAEEVMNYLRKNYHSLDKSYLSFIFNSLDLFYLRGLRKGKKLARSLFEMYKFQLEVNSEFYKTLTMSIIEFKNILQTALRLNEIEWAENFVRKYIHFIRDEDKDGLLNYCGALLAFEKKQFEEVIVYINKVKTLHYSFKEYLKVLHIMVCYEFSQIEHFYSLLESFRKFINNSNLVSAEKLLYYKEFARFANELIKLKISNSAASADLRVLRKEIEESSAANYLLNERWFLDKLDELEKQY
jgi:hypothetical protein